MLNKKDCVKATLRLPIFLVTALNLNPEKLNAFTPYTFILMLLVGIAAFYGQVSYIVVNINDVTKLCKACLSLSASFAGLTKLCIHYKQRNLIRKILGTVRTEFWSVDMSDETVYKNLSGYSRLLNVTLYSITCAAFISASKFLSEAFTSSRSRLPFPSWYPFDWTPTPIYVLMCCCHIIMHIYITLPTVLGHDYLFMTICFNTTAQFKMLSGTLNAFGTENAKTILLQQNDSDTESAKKDISSGQDDQRLFLKMCIKYHVKLLQFCDDLQETFSLTIFLHYFAAGMAICTSLFLITVNDKSDVANIIIFCVGNTLQLFLYCIVANDLTYQSEHVGDEAYLSNWYAIKNCDLKQELIFLIRRAQKKKKMSALGLADLNLENFINTMKVFFSFYTLLTTLNEKP